MIAIPRTKWLRAGVLAAIITILWCGVIFPTPPFPHFFQVEVSSSTPTVVKVYYSRGAGFRESESAQQSVAAATDFKTVQLVLPPGKYREFRFAPLSETGTVRFRNIRITTFDGRTVRRITTDDFPTSARAARLREADGIFQLQTSADGTNPVLSIKFASVLRLASGFWSRASLVVPRWFWTFGLSFVSLLLIAFVSRMRFTFPPRLCRFYTQRPQTALAICAVIATAMSCYPVVFFGKSFLSPTSGVLLLYDQAPTLPGFTDLRSDDARGSDVGAMMWQHLPYTVQQSRALRSGALPLWNRYNSVGATLFGQGQSMFGDPLHFLVIAAGGEAWAFDFKFVVVRALFAFGIGLCVWGLTRDFAAAAIALFASAFIAFFNYRGNHPALFSLGYSPWILVSWLHLVASADRKSFRRAIILWFVANWFVFTSGTVKEAYLLGLSLNITGLMIFLRIRYPSGEKFRRLLIIGLASAAFLLVASPIWWTFLHSLANAYTAYETPTVVQIQRGWFVGLFDDLFYREFIPDNQVYQPAANFLVLLGCFCAVLQPRRLLASRGGSAVLITALIAISLAFEIVPASWLLAVPFLRNVYHIHNVFSCVAVVHLCVLAGWGFSVARQPLVDGRANRLALKMVCLLAAMFLAYYMVVPPVWTNGPAWHGWSDLTLYQSVVYLHVILLPLAILVLLYAAARTLRGHTVTGAVFVPALLALTLVLGRHGQHLPFFQPTPILFTPGSRAELFPRSPAVDFLHRGIKDEPGRIIGTGTNFFPGFVSVYDFEGINGPDALINRRYREFSEAAGITKAGDWRYEMPAAALPKWRPVLDFLNVEFVVAPPSTLADPAGYGRVARLDFDIFHSEHRWPRAFFTDRVEHYDTTAQFVGLIRDRSPGKPFAAQQKGDNVADLPPVISATAGEGTVVPASDYVLEPNRTSFTVAAPGAGVVVLQEAWLADDFQATLNGKPVPYLRVNHMFKGIVIPTAGTYRVAFAYWPRGFTTTLVLSVVGLSGFIFLVFAIGQTRDAG